MDGYEQFVKHYVSHRRAIMDSLYELEDLTEADERMNDVFEDLLYEVQRSELMMDQLFSIYKQKKPYIM